MGIEIIHHQPDHLCCREIDIDQQLHLLGKVLLGAPRGHINLAPSQQRLHEQKQVGRPFTFVLVVIADRLSGSGRQGVAFFAVSCTGLSSKQTWGRRASYGSAYKSKTSSMCQT